MLYEVITKNLLVFDLDSTLFDVSPRTKKILQDYTLDPKHDKIYPKELEILKEVEIQVGDWGRNNFV